MYGDRCTMAWNNSLKYFHDAAEAHKSSKGFMCCPCRLHSIIHQGTQHEGPLEEEAPEFDGSEYLNDTGDSDADLPEKMDVEDVGAEVWNSCLIDINRNFSRHPDRGSRNGNEARRKGWRAYHHHHIAPRW